MAIMSNLAEINKSIIIGGEVTEIVSAADNSATPKEGSFLQSFLSAPVGEAGLLAQTGANTDTDMELAPYNERDPLISGGDSILQNQNPITVSIPEPTPTLEAPSKPSEPVQPYYTAGPYLDGYFIFPTTGYNRGKLHAYNAVDISHGSDCIDENIPVYAAASGAITAAYSTQSTARFATGGRGNYISILHSNGIGSEYFHLKKILVSVGQYVNQGTVIAYMGGYPGMAGSGNSTGCHLHFGIRGAAQPFAR